jgi:hypothetical protein
MNSIVRLSSYSRNLIDQNKVMPFFSNIVINNLNQISSQTFSAIDKFTHLGVSFVFDEFFSASMQKTNMRIRSSDKL